MITSEMVRDFLTIAVLTIIAVGALFLYLFLPHNKATANDLHLQAQLDEINRDFEAGRISYKEFQRRITEAKSSLTQ